MKIGIKDIAKQANVSTSAVSLALNNKAGISEATRDKILAVAKDLEYLQPSVHGKQSSITVKFLHISRHGHTLNNNHEHFIASYLNGIMDSAKLHNISVEIESFDSSIPLEGILEKINSNNLISGYIILATELQAEDIRMFLATGKEFVFIDSYVYSVPADYVNMDNMEAVYSAVSYLKELGHTSIGMIKSSIKTGNFLLREQSFTKAMNDLNLNIKKSMLFDVDSTFDGAYSDMIEYLSKKPSLPTALFAINDIIALGCIKALNEFGYSIPNDISIIAFDNIPMSEMSAPTLSTVNVHNRQVGQVAADTLYLKIKHQSNRAPMTCLINAELIIRDSTEEYKNNAHASN